MVLERNASGGVINHFVRDLNGNLIRCHRNGWYLFNARGDVVQRVSDQGNILHTYQYDAFGNEIETTKSGGHGSTGSVSTNPFRFAGMYWDAHTQTYMTPNRQFNPRIGRWTQPDPYWGIHNMQFGSNPAMRNDLAMPNSWAIMQSANLFAFAVNNPVRFIDPSGLYIRLAGTQNRQNETLSYLQQLTNDELGVANRIVYIRTRNDSTGRETGTELIRSLIANEEHRVTIQRGTATFEASNWRNASIEGVGSGGTVRFNPNQNLSRTHIAELQNHMYIALGHELIHAERAMRGVIVPLNYTMGYAETVGRLTLWHTARVEELVTIGIQPGNVVLNPSGRLVPAQTVTENSLRAEHGIRARTRF